jgi:hypothetical protein
MRGLPLHYRSNNILVRAQRRGLACVSLVIAMLLATGCQSPRVQQSLTVTLPAEPVAAQLEFWHGLEDRPITCNDEAFHGLLIFVNGQDDSKDYDARVAELKSLHLLTGSFNRPAEEAVQRGTVASVLVRALKIKGGWALTVLGPMPRYATRELVYLSLFPPSSPEQTFSGSEFVGIMGKADDYQRGNPGEAPATDVTK